ncbi:hypothetical protein BD626DRAFT_527137 [Schizophyllum amplum]|uniref:Uncharacterized protein n=1 Tax=Schizophyllum amplum TaxID=97359 RepID=A0A550BS89_9AGAR|nr:hypothetical protein BD626DRAFT_527137 [Auriculariopsis ampla]
MFSLPHIGRAPCNGSDRSTDKEGRPVIDVEEDGASLEKLLRWCDPRCTPPALETWDDVSAMSNLSMKYDAPCVIRRVSECLQGSSFIAKAPLQVYAIAMRVHNRQLAQMAAAEASRIGIAKWKYCTELDQMSGSAYHHLLTYHLARAQAAVKVLDQSALSKVNYSEMRAGKSVFGKPSWSHSEGCSGGWWTDYIQPFRATIEHYPGSPLFSRAFTIDMQMTKCTNCRDDVQEFTTKFVVGLANMIDQALKQVSHSLR